MPEILVCAQKYSISCSIHLVFQISPVWFSSCLLCPICWHTLVIPEFLCICLWDAAAMQWEEHSPKGYKDDCKYAKPGYILNCQSCMRWQTKVVSGLGVANEKQTVRQRLLPKRSNFLRHMELMSVPTNPGTTHKHQWPLRGCRQHGPSTMLDM